MQSTFSKQVAYNQRIMEAESAIAGINCEVPHFLEDMTIEEPVYVCINSSEEMKRDEQAIAGQLWVQGDRQLTASNAAPEGMANTRDSALLYAAAEAVTWNHASQPNEPRKGQRVIIYPKDLPQLDEFLVTCNPTVDPEDGHPVAYETILRESAKFEITPLFLREDSNPVISDPTLAAKVPEWLAISRQVATGNRRRVLENGRDVPNSSDEDDENMKPDKLTGMYTAEMDPKVGPKVLSPTEGAFQRAAGRAMKEQSQPAQERVPLASPANSEDEWMPDDQRKALNRGKKLAQKAAPKGVPKPPYAERIPDPVVQAPVKGAALEIKKATASPRASAHMPTGAKALFSKVEGKPATRSRAVAEPSTLVPAVGISKQVTKAAASQRAPADSSPMVTRSQASRAGGLRSGRGSGQTDTSVAQGNPSKT
jgi:hypothetical protein